MFNFAGLTEVQNLVDRRLQVNRKKKVKMQRVWIQSKFQKPLLLSPNNPEETTERDPCRWLYHELQKLKQIWVRIFPINLVLATRKEKYIELKTFPRFFCKCMCVKMVWKNKEQNPKTFLTSALYAIKLYMFSKN